MSVKFDVNDLEYDKSLMNIDLKIKQNDDKTVVNMKSELVRNLNHFFCKKFH